MLTKIKIRNFKRFEDVEIDLGKAVVFIGANNSGKTTALQAIALWDIGVRRWNEKRKGKPSPEKKPGVAVNRRDLSSIPAPSANLLWRDLKVRRSNQIENKPENIRIEFIVNGITEGKSWSCGLEFDYANEESFYCRPLRLENQTDRMPMPDEAGKIGIAFLPPMSGLADREYVKEPGEISVLIGQGQTAQVIRNLCYQIYKNKAPDWEKLVGHLQDMFGITLRAPQYISERSEITMAYEDEKKNLLDLSSSGRGLQQILLLLTHLYANPGAILLLDEPDAHLEILRQRTIYNLLTEVAEAQGSQIIAASHSEVILEEAAGKDTVVAFVGKPHLIDKNRSTQLLKSLQHIGWDQYFHAEKLGWVLYLEGSTDLSILRTFAKTLDHKAQKYLTEPFIKYLGNNIPGDAKNHFTGLQEAKNDLVGLALFDRLERPIGGLAGLTELMWKKREIENYFCTEEILLSYAISDVSNDLDLFSKAEEQKHLAAMKKSISEVTNALAILDSPGPWSPNIKASDDVLDRILRRYYQELELPLRLRKSQYHVLVSLMPKEQIDPEITEKLDAIVSVAKKAVPTSE